MSLAAYQLLVNDRNRADSASPKDVRYVLNWCGLGEQRTEKVVHSYVSSRSFTGDYLDAYAIKISHVEVSELTQQSNHFGRRWYRCDQLPPVLNDALTFVAGWFHGDEIPWFPDQAQLRSSEFYVYPWTIFYHGLHPTAAELIFIRPSDNMIFFIGSKT